MTTHPVNHADTVRALIAVAGLAPDASEIDAAISQYPQVRAAIDRLYSVDLDHEEDLAVSFEA
jgi:hypothetical protein